MQIGQAIRRPATSTRTPGNFYILSIGYISSLQYGIDVNGSFR